VTRTLTLSPPSQERWHLVIDLGGFPSKKDVLQELQLLNQEVARRLAAGEPVMPPGVAPEYGEPSAPLTRDCLSISDSQ
jgi:hypothetical protein